MKAKTVIILLAIAVVLYFMLRKPRVATNIIEADKKATAA